MSFEEEQPIWDHLEELAVRLRKILFAVVVASVIFAVFPSDLSRILRWDFSDYRPLVSIVMEVIQVSLLPEGVTLIAFNWLDTFYIFILVAVALGVLITLPFIAYELYLFIAPALYSHERRSVAVFVVVFTMLFSLGASYAYFLLLPTTFRVLYNFVYQTRVIPFFSVKDFFNMVAVGLMGSGIFYTFPLVLYMLVKADLIEVQTLKENRKQLFVIITVITAVLTPDPTPFSMLLMTIPFYALYELTIQILSRVKRREKPVDEVLEMGVRASREFLERVQASSNQGNEV